MFILGSTIHTSYGYLSTTSYGHLQAAINHEIGHTKIRSLIITCQFISTVLFFCLCLLVSPMIIYFIPVMYFILCWFTRIGEYKADEYSYHVAPDGIIELLLSEGLRMDHKVIDNSFLYWFRFHPSYERRVRYLKRKKKKDVFFYCCLWIWSIFF